MGILFILKAFAAASSTGCHILGTPVVPLFPFYLGVSLGELNIRKKGTLIIQGSLGNLV